ncbi:hypothetical protein ABK733_17125 [Citrobacter freundii]|uniref:gp53-like domain-containing protein n=1 Tax=Citrobacter freundii TaxID=546 RepID=UPI002B26ADD6|nr:hypothetical protein [Citrobacter freundii]MEA8863721.1 hypothetical protein [Citrobacter freundii]
MRPLMPPVQTPDNLFHDGNPLTGELGTIVDAEHLNNEQAAIRDTQSELIAILTAAAMEPESTAGQLLAALNKLYAPLNDTLGALSSLVGGANKLPYFTSANAAALTALSSIGRDIVGKATVADVLTYLGLGTAATKNVGNGANQIPTMANFTSGPGWMKFPDGTIMQFGTNIAGQISFPTTINFPVPFTSGCRIATSFDSASNIANDCPAFATSPAGTGLLAFYLMSSRTGGNGAGANWIAIGK